jgi:hypothetical protein
MAPKRPSTNVKSPFSVMVLEEELKGYHKDKELAVVDKVCSMDVTDLKSLAAIAEALLRSAMSVDMYDRKPLAVLARRLHDRLPRCASGPPNLATRVERDEQQRCLRYEIKRYTI